MDYSWLLTMSRIDIIHRILNMNRVFILDILSSLPYSWFAYWLSLDTLFTDPQYATSIRLHAILHLPRLLRLARFFTYVEMFETTNIMRVMMNPTFVRLAKLGRWIHDVSCHVMLCHYYVMFSIMS